MNLERARDSAEHVRAGGRHPVAQFHPYHTKVPPSVIRARIERFTEPGELVLDPFAGSGMTGVAALDCGRRALLGDLSPAATFIARINTRGHDVGPALDVLTQALGQSEEALGHLYRSGPVLVDYYVWSDVFRCPACAGTFSFFDAGVEHLGTKVRTLKAFPCPLCRQTGLSIRQVSRVLEPDGRKRKQLVWVAGRGPAGRVSRPPLGHDLVLAAATQQVPPTHWVPDVGIDVDAYSARLAQLGAKGIRHVNDLLSHRNLLVFSDLWHRVSVLADDDVAPVCRAVLTGAFTTVSERQGYFGGGGGMSGNLYMPVIRMEKNVHTVVRRRLGLLRKAEAHKASWSTTAGVLTQSATLLGVATASVDYVYTDPPFGANMIYSELNLALEAWLGRRTRGDLEAVVDPTRGLDVDAFGDRLTTALREVGRVLRPGRAMTLQFHNSDEGAWGALQAALDAAGFEVEAVAVLDKGGTTLLSDIRQNSVSQDLLIDARPRRRSAAVTPPRADGDRELVAALRRILSGAPPHLQGEKLRQYAYSALVAEQLHAKTPVTFSSTAIYALLKEMGVLGSAEKEARRRKWERVPA